MADSAMDLDPAPSSSRSSLEIPDLDPAPSSSRSSLEIPDLVNAETFECAEQPFAPPTTIEQLRKTLLDIEFLLSEQALLREIYEKSPHRSRAVEESIIKIAQRARELKDRVRRDIHGYEVLEENASALSGAKPKVWENDNTYKRAYEEAVWKLDWERKELSRLKGVVESGDTQSEGTMAREKVAQGRSRGIQKKSAGTQSRSGGAQAKSRDVNKPQERVMPSKPPSKPQTKAKKSVAPPAKESTEGKTGFKAITDLNLAKDQEKPKIMLRIKDPKFKDPNKPATPPTLTTAPGGHADSTKTSKPTRPIVKPIPSAMSQSAVKLPINQGTAAKSKRSATPMLAVKLPLTRPPVKLLPGFRRCGKNGCILPKEEFDQKTDGSYYASCRDCKAENDRYRASKKRS